jgi:hypothetical protein
MSAVYLIALATMTGPAEGQATAPAQAGMAFDLDPRGS